MYAGTDRNTNTRYQVSRGKDSIPHAQQLVRHKHVTMYEEIISNSVSVTKLGKARRSQFDQTSQKEYRCSIRQARRLLLVVYYC
jgi:anaerobic glycerol-3-phosphate dehydrogenase